MINKCPKCGGKMIEGILHIPHGILLLTELRFLAKGEPKLGWIKKSGRKTKAYCCEKCGYVEQYAEGS